MGIKSLIALGCCPFVTRNVDIFLSCNSDSSSLILGYMIGSPTRLSAQCLTVWASCQRSIRIPGIPLVSLIIDTCSFTASSTIIIGSSVFQRHSLPTGFL